MPVAISKDVVIKPGGGGSYCANERHQLLSQYLSCTHALGIVLLLLDAKWPSATPTLAATWPWPTPGHVVPVNEVLELKCVGSAAVPT